MALTNVAANSVAAQGVGTTASVSFAQAPVAGNLLICQASINMTLNPTVSTPAGWTLVPTNGDANAGAGNARSLLFYRVADGTETTVSSTLSTSNAWRLALEEFSNGVPSTWTLDQSMKQTSAGSSSMTTGTTPATTVANELVIAAFSKKNTEAISGVTAGYTVTDNATVSSGGNAATNVLAYLIVAATGTQVCTCTSSGARPYGANIATFYAVASATTYNDAPSGGLVLGGSAAASRATDMARSGGIVLGGSASTVVAHGYSDAPSGGLALGGSSASALNLVCGAVADPYTVLLIHADGTNGSTAFTDSSPAAHPVTAVGNTQVSTAQSKFGQSALLDGTGDYLALDGSSDFAFGTGDYTVDFWVRVASLPRYAHLYDGRPPFTLAGYLALYLDVATGVVHCSNGTVDMAGTTNLNTATWVHVAVSRAGTTRRLFINGTIEATDAADNVNLSNFYPDRPWFGGKAYGGDSGLESLLGNFDEIRVSKGIARWTANFPPPSAPYTVTAGGLSGGIVLNGSCSSSLSTGNVINSTPSGGIILGGSAASDRAVSLPQTGGIVLGGTAAVTRAVSYTPSAGIVLGGSVAATQALVYTPTGGVVLGGSAAISLARAFTTSGGIVLGGSAALTWVRAPTPSGGIILNGTCSTSQSTAGNYTDAPTGGIVLGGAATSARDFSKTPSGGIVLGGSVVTVLQLPGPIYTVTPSGGLVLGGSVTQDVARAFATTGGIVLGGSVVTILTLPGPTYTVAPSGGIRLEGTCTTSMSFLIVYNLAPVGGIQFGGVAGTAGEAVALPPVVDRIDGGWTDQTGGTELYAAVDEITVNDADYIKSTSSPVTADICEIAFTPAIDPFSSTGHVLTYRYGSDAEGWTTVTRTLTAAQADAITQYGHLSVKFEAKV